MLLRLLQRQEEVGLNINLCQTDTGLNYEEMLIINDY